jgi:hypothetical protein
MDSEDMVMMVACVVQLYQGSHIQSAYLPTALQYVAEAT